jgi:transposase
MLHAGLDLCRRKVDVCLLDEEGEHLDQLAVPPDSDSLRTLARRIDEVHGGPVCAVVESMTRARLVHDTLEHAGWSVEIADAQKVQRLPPLACKTDRIDSMVLAVALAPRPDLGDLAFHALVRRVCGSAPSWLSG